MLYHIPDQAAAASAPQLARHSKRDGKMYRCSAASCQAQIETLSGLVQHVQSGKCGIKQNRMVKDTMGALTAGLGQMRLTY